MALLWSHLLGKRALLAHHLYTVVLAQKLPCLGSGSIATHHCAIAVEILGDFLEWCVFGLDKELPHHDQLEADPDTVHDVVLPADGVKGDRVDVLVEPERHVDEEEHDGETLWMRILAFCLEPGEVG